MQHLFEACKEKVHHLIGLKGAIAALLGLSAQDVYVKQRPNGDHRHVGKREETYAFRDVETLMRDFLADVEGWRSI